jgi:hypothetical protein
LTATVTVTQLAMHAVLFYTATVDWQLAFSAWLIDLAIIKTEELSKD